MSDKWHNRFMGLANEVASWSKDKSTQVGAVIVKNRRVVSMGYNGIPVGCDDDIEERHRRPIKYKYFEHAERNAIYNAAREGGPPIFGCTLYCTLFPCTDCARAIIQSGIQTLVTKSPDFNRDNFGDDFRISVEMLDEAGVNIIYIK